MRIFFAFLFLPILLISCNQQSPNDKEGVVLELLNDSLTYIMPIKHENVTSHWYDSDIERDSALNVVRCRITNNTKEKLLFLLRDIDLSDISSLEPIIKEDGEYLSGNNVMGHSFYEDLSDYNLDRENEVSGSNSSLYNQYLKQQVVLGPGESLGFNAFLTLPFVVSDMGYSYYYEFYDSLNYTFSLKYKLDPAISDVLPDSEKKNLERNNIRFFEGELSTKEVKLVRKDMW